MSTAKIVRDSAAYKPAICQLANLDIQGALVRSKALFE